jgi:hypothetical protein
VPAARSLYVGVVSVDAHVVHRGEEFHELAGAAAEIKYTIPGPSANVVIQEARMRAAGSDEALEKHIDERSREGGSEACIALSHVN